jgi:hypothetical protein
LEAVMKKISPFRTFSGCLVAINFFAVNVFVLIESFYRKDELEIFFTKSLPNSTKSQLDKVLDEETVRVAIQDNSAYWVVDNILYKCDINEEGRIDNENAEKVDVFNLSEKEISNLISIIDSINS